MGTLAHRLEMADRLNQVFHRIGFVLWQIQELESVAAQYFVLVAEAQKGMGLDAGNVLIENAQKKTFGATLSRLGKAGLVPPDLEGRFRHLLAERNWLVHRSRADSRNVAHHDAAARKLVVRLDGIAEESLSLLKEIAELTERFVKKHGVTEEYIRETANHLLEEWHKPDAT
jgi:uncharacterized protein YutE (UPF0331/DUF86 family)